MSILTGGGYAEYIKCKANHLIEIPQNIEITRAAAIPETWLTAYLNCKLTNVRKGDYVLVHAAASGVGTSILQLLKHYYGAYAISLCSEEKINEIEKFDAGYVVNRNLKDEEKLDLVQKYLNQNNRKGCDVIMDCVASSQFNFVLILI